MTNLNSNVEEMAYLILSSSHIGVSDSLEDIFGHIETLPEEECIRIIKGTKDQLLSLEQKILIFDQLNDNPYENVLTVPERLEDYNLINRKPTNKKLFTALLK